MGNIWKAAAFRIDHNQEEAGLPNVEERIDCFNLDFWFFSSFQPNYSAVSDNELQTLPEGIFDNLTSLTDL